MGKVSLIMHMDADEYSEYKFGRVRYGLNDKQAREFARLVLDEGINRKEAAKAVK